MGPRRNDEAAFPTHRRVGDASTVGRMAMGREEEEGWSDVEQDHGGGTGKERNGDAVRERLHSTDTRDRGTVLRDRENEADASKEETSTAADEFFLYHKLGNKDTLAGLAVKYNVQLTDIKRANLIDTENGLYALHVVRIPKRPMQVGALQRLAFARRENRNRKQNHARKSVDLSPSAEAALMKLQRHYSTSDLASYDDTNGRKSVGFLERAARQARKSVGALLDQTWNHQQVTFIGRKGTEAGYAAPGEDKTRLRKRSEGWGEADLGQKPMGIEMTETNASTHEASIAGSSRDVPDPANAVAPTVQDRRNKSLRFPNLATLKQKSSASAARLSKTLPFKSNSKLD